MISRRGFFKSTIATALMAYLRPIDHFVPIAAPPTCAPATTVFTLGDGTKISLSDWVDDKHYETITFKTTNRNFRRG